MKKSVNLYFNYDIDTKEKIDKIKELGYDEFYTGMYDAKETMSWKEQIEYAKSIGLECSMIHCSYYEPKLNNFWLDNEIGEEICNSYIEQIIQCHEYTKNFVVHLNGSYDSIVSKVGLERIKKILSVCEKYDVNLCIENLYSREEIPYIFSHIKHKNLKICLDYGHKNFLTKTFDIMKEYGKYVTVLHIHDNFGEKDEHLIVGHGAIDWEYVAEGLKDKQQLVLCSEIKLHEKEHYVEDLKENLKGLCKLNNLVNQRSVINDSPSM